MAERHHRDPVERRLQQVGAESERVRNQIRRLSGDVHVRRADTPSPRGFGDTRTGDLFAWAAKQRKFEQAGSISVRRRPQGGRGRALRTGSGARERDPRLIAYLHSGSFGRLAPLRDADDVPRNRFVFFAVVSAVLAYVIYRIVSH